MTDTELVARWQPVTEQGWVAFCIDDKMPDLFDDIKAWAEDDFEGVIGTITIERKPKGWVESLPEHDGW